MRKHCVVDNSCLSVRWLDNITDSMDMNLSKLLEILEDRGAWHSIAHRVPKSRT